jgi:hypothetical protein
MFRLPQVAKAVEFFGVSPADDAATVAGHLTKHAHPTALDPGEQGILRHPQLRGQVDDKPLALTQGFPVSSGPLSRAMLLQLSRQAADDITVELLGSFRRSESLFVRLFGDLWDRSLIRQRFQSFGGQRSGFLLPARR